MNRKLLLGILFFSVISIVSALENWGGGPSDKWFVNFTEAQKAALSENKNILLLNFGSDWNELSRKMEKILLPNEDFINLAEENFILLFIDSPMSLALPQSQLKHNNQVRMKYKIVNKIPHTLILNVQGQVVGEISGFTGIGHYLNQLQKFAVSDDENIDEEDSNADAEKLSPSADSPADIMQNVPKSYSRWTRAAGQKSWHVNYDLAMAEAKKTGKKVYVLNTGSDWCGFCVKLRNELLDKKKFQKFAEKNLVVLYLDSPRKKKLHPEQIQHNMQIRKKLKFGGGVPSAIILDSNGKEIGRIGGYMSEDKYMKKLKDICK